MKQHKNEGGWRLCWGLQMIKSEEAQLLPQTIVLVIGLKIMLTIETVLGEFRKPTSTQEEEGTNKENKLLSTLEFALPLAVCLKWHPECGVWGAVEDPGKCNWPIRLHPH
jgi:hypothetical protein